MWRGFLPAHQQVVDRNSGVTPRCGARSKRATVTVFDQRTRSPLRFAADSRSPSSRARCFMVIVSRFRRTNRFQGPTTEMGVRALMLDGARGWGTATMPVPVRGNAGTSVVALSLVGEVTGGVPLASLVGSSLPPRNRADARGRQSSSDTRPFGQSSTWSPQPMPASALPVAEREQSG